MKMKDYNIIAEQILINIIQNNDVNYDISILNCVFIKKWKTYLYNPIKDFFEENESLLNDTNISLICDKRNNFAENIFSTHKNHQALYNIIKDCDYCISDHLFMVDIINNPPEPNDKLKEAHKRYKIFLNDK